MGHRTEQVPQREVLVNTPTKRAWSSVWRQRSALVDAMKRVSYLQSERPLATKGQAPKKGKEPNGSLRWTPATELTVICWRDFSGPFPQEEDKGVKRKCEGRERGDFWKSSSEEDRDERGLDFLGGNKIDLGHGDLKSGRRKTNFILLGHS
ncbi:hypothetical protein AVEN_62408-1 [Araneus ventricosus]|uniref:Uncharacterized protein n=1 Tax=Araneus ventricosus TaxID=182803 RepID=A0A4Y2TW33_ARAVE|nr:hypothetical protein AVEN_62408-1 [Araneus ventricosus]